MQIIMAARHTRITFPVKILNLFHSKNSLFHLFIFLIGLPIGFICSFYLQSFSTAVQTSVLNVFHSLLLPSSPLPHANTLSLVSPPRVSEGQKIPMMHNMSDEDLVKSVMEVSTIANNTNYKVAFMFLTPGPLPLSPLWELFFKGYEGLFTIYVHPHPSYNDTITQDSVFYDTRITSQPVYWGDISMIDAERRLLANALLDTSNQRFVLLSDSCIPLFNFTTTYNYLVNSNLSYIASFDDKRKSGRGRYNPQMAPNITIQDWRKGSQWFEVNRDLALAIVAEQNYYSLFKEYCHPPCYNDEHYLSTLVNILYGRLNSNRTITYVDWSIVGPHPRKFGGGEITKELLNSIRFGSTECIYNDNTTPMCVLFARKFTPSTLNPLLTFAGFLFGTNN
ncbi:glycosyltransferase BC10-like [Bidens hawaiensis]|uniref:glycosyltransferase BC10-like n=1 Tax=Bidens hawaiensis TaxID=980011 RepID=UPI00404A88F0